MKNFELEIMKGVDCAPFQVFAMSFGIRKGQVENQHFDVGDELLADFSSGEDGCDVGCLFVSTLLKLDQLEPMLEFLFEVLENELLVFLQDQVAVWKEVLESLAEIKVGVFEQLHFFPFVNVPKDLDPVYLKASKQEVLSDKGIERLLLKSWKNPLK